MRARMRRTSIYDHELSKVCIYGNKLMFLIERNHTFELRRLGCFSIFFLSKKWWINLSHVIIGLLSSPRPTAGKVKLFHDGQQISGPKTLVDTGLRPLDSLRVLIVVHDLKRGKSDGMYGHGARRHVHDMVVVDCILYNYHTYIHTE